MTEIKKKVVVLFGGQSSEHEISCRSAVTITEYLDKEKYDIILVGITSRGKWLKVNAKEDVKSGAWRDSQTKAIISPDAVDKALVVTDNQQTSLVPVDVIFPVLHGMYGEDGTVQGLFEMAQIPYVGCGVLASAVAMDKAYTKIIVDTLHIRQASYVTISGYELKNMDMVISKIESKIQYPIFVKPSKAGSSKGISKAFNTAELKAGLKEAALHDTKILIEETILGREIECAVLGRNEAEASNVGEILAADEFYSYDAKYNNQESITDISPVLPDGVLEEVRNLAVKIFKAIDGFGLSRVDFFLEKDTNQVVFNEINTFPGFTSISMYPMLWEAKGLDKKRLLDELIALACNR